LEYTLAYCDVSNITTVKVFSLIFGGKAGAYQSRAPYWAQL
jgi:hypothetical protein